MRARFLALAVLSAVAACNGEDPDAGPTWGPAFDATDTGWLLSVWGPTADELYAVGGTPDAGRVVRFDGTRWRDVDLDVPVPLLNWAFGFGSEDLWVVGNEGAILRYDGTWTRTPTVTDQNLWGVWGASPDDLWAVGGNGRAEGQATLLRYDGQRWRRIEVPPLTRGNVNAFFKVWGTAADDVYIVGQSGAVLHWNGAALNEELVGTSRDLISVWGSGGRVVIAGGRANGVVVTGDGATWRRIDLGATPGLNGVWMRRPDLAHLVGVNGTILELDVESTEVQERTPREVLLDFHAVYGDPDGGRMVAVGGNFQFVSGPYEGVAYSRELSNVD